MSKTPPEPVEWNLFKDCLNLEHVTSAHRMLDHYDYCPYVNYVLKEMHEGEEFSHMAQVALTQFDRYHPDPNCSCDEFRNWLDAVAIALVRNDDPPHPEEYCE